MHRGERTMARQRQLTRIQILLNSGTNGGINPHTQLTKQQPCSMGPYHGLPTCDTNSGTIYKDFLKTLLCSK